MLSKRLSRIEEESATIKRGHIAKKLQDEGEEVLNFTLGKPCEAAKHAFKRSVYCRYAGFGIWTRR